MHCMVDTIYQITLGNRKRILPIPEFRWLLLLLLLKRKSVVTTRVTNHCLNVSRSLVMYYCCVCTNNDELASQQYDSWLQSIHHHFSRYDTLVVFSIYLKWKFVRQALTTFCLLFVFHSTCECKANIHFVLVCCLETESGAFQSVRSSNANEIDAEHRLDFICVNANE